MATNTMPTSKPPAQVRPILQVEHVTKRFPGVLALDNVTFDIRHGEVVALLGENGAGKSTIIKILSGVHSPGTGRIAFRGENISVGSPQEAQAIGISTIHQERSLAPHLTTVQNIFLGREK